MNKTIKFEHIFLTLEPFLESLQDFHVKYKYHSAMMFPCVPPPVDRKSSEVPSECSMQQLVSDLDSKANGHLKKDTQVHLALILRSLRTKKAHSLQTVTLEETQQSNFVRVYKRSVGADVGACFEIWCIRDLYELQ